MEELIQRHFAVIRIAFGETEFRLEIRRDEGALVEDEIPDIRCVLRQGIENGFSEGVAARIPLTDS